MFSHLTHLSQLRGKSTREAYIGVCRANQANGGQLFQAGWPSSALWMPSCSAALDLYVYMYIPSNIHRLKTTTRACVSMCFHLTGEDEGYFSYESAVVGEDVAVALRIVTLEERCEV